MTILIVTDNPLFTIGMRSVIEGVLMSARIYETDSLQNSLTLDPEAPFLLMVLDATVRDGKDIYTLRTFKKKYPQAAVFVNLGEQIEFMYTYIRAGVKGLFSKTSTRDEIAEALRTSDSKKRFIGGDVQELLLTHLSGENTNHELTRRERLVADLLVENKSRNDIAIIVGIKPQTVSLYKRKIFDKLHVRNVTELGIKLRKLLVVK